jgi:sulfatase maturation enzyme AslB (radical SAM superfamily)
MFEGHYRKLHKRTIKYQPYFTKVACSCIPGAVRLYCSVNGDYFPCEKVETTSHLCIGNVTNGIDCEKVNKMIDYLSTETDCDSCTGKYFCSICPNYITENFQGNIDNILIKKQCQELTKNVTDQLVTYTRIMEKQPSLLDFYKSETTGDDWLPHVQFVVNLSRSHSHNHLLSE